MCDFRGFWGSGRCDFRRLGGYSVTFKVLERTEEVSEDVGERMRASGLGICLPGSLGSEIWGSEIWGSGGHLSPSDRDLRGLGGLWGSGRCLAAVETRALDSLNHV